MSVSGYKLKSSAFASGTRITDVGCDLRVLESIYSINGKPEPYPMCNKSRTEIITYYCTSCLPWIKLTADLYSRSFFLTAEMVGLKVNYLHVSCNHHLSWLDAQHQNPPREQNSELHFCTIIDLAAYSPLRVACSYAYRETGKLLSSTTRGIGIPCMYEYGIELNNCDCVDAFEIILKRQRGCVDPFTVQSEPLWTFTKLP